MIAEPDLIPNARRIFDLRYSLKDVDGSPIETPGEAIQRVAENVAAPIVLYQSTPFVPSVEGLPDPDLVFPIGTAVRQYHWMQKQGKIDPKTNLSEIWEDNKTKQASLARKFADELLLPMKFVPNSPTWTGAGTPLGQYAACFVLPISDDLGRERSSIFETLKVAALIQQTGGGNGFDFSDLRPKNDLVSRSRGKSSGPCSFARAYNAAFGTIAQGGTRRGANMMILRVDHPDIFEFIDFKTVEGDISNFNISVAITEEFMRAVAVDADFDLKFKGRSYQTVSSRQLWDKIVSSAHKLGDPGVFFVDRANEDNPCPTHYTLAATNPCVTGNTLVSTVNGWIPVRDIIEGDEIATVLGVGAVKTIETHGSVPVYEIKFSDGGTLCATATHQFHARDSSTKFFVPTRLDELEIGQWVRVAKSPFPTNLVAPENGRTGDQRLLGFMAGVMAGDGSCSPKTVALGQLSICSSSDDAEWNDVLRVALELLGFSSSVSVDKGTKSVRLYPQPSRDFTSWFVNLPMLSAKAPDKTLPPEYVNSNEEFLVGLVDGLFSTDGNVNLRSNHPQLRFDSASETMVQQLRLILLMFGVHGRVSRSERNPAHRIDGRLVVGGPKFTLTIAGESFGRFADQITLSNPDKQARIDEARLRCNFTGGNWAASVVSIEPAGVATVYDLYEPTSDTWITEGYVSRGCGEQALPPYSNCCLGAIAVNRFVKRHKDTVEFDWAELARTVMLSVNFLDLVVDANRYVPEVPELEQAAMNERRIGLGVMGVADTLLMMGLSYRGEEGLDFIDQLMEFIRYHALLASTDLAKQRGTFEWYDDSIYGTGDWEIPTSALSEVLGREVIRSDFGRPNLNWLTLKKRIDKHGLRNACQMTVAPTGTTSNVAGLEGSGIEPLFALSYSRKVMQDGKDIVLDYLSPLFEAELDFMGYSDKDKDEILREVAANGGSCQHLGGRLYNSITDVFVVASDISPLEHVNMQAVCQAWVDNAISKTINMPFEATVEEVSEVYRRAWELGCKGITIYRQGSRDLEVLVTTKTKTSVRGVVVDTEIVSTQQDAEYTPADYFRMGTEASKGDDLKLELTMGQTIEEDAWPILNPMEMPEYVRSTFEGSPKGLPARVFEVETPFGTLQCYISELRSHPGRPFDIRLQIGKAGNDKHADVEAIGRMASVALRTGVDVAVLIAHLEGIGGKTSYGFGNKKVLSVGDGLGKLLRSLYLDQGEEERTTIVWPSATEWYQAMSPGTRGEHQGKQTLKQEVPDSGWMPKPALHSVCPKCKNSTMVFEAGCSHCDGRLGGCGDYTACD